MKMGLCCCGFIFPNHTYNVDCPECGDGVQVDWDTAESWGWVWDWGKYETLVNKEKGYFVCEVCGHSEMNVNGGCLYCEPE